MARPTRKPDSTRMSKIKHDVLASLRPNWKVLAKDFGLLLTCAVIVLVCATIIYQQVSSLAHFDYGVFNDPRPERVQDALQSLTSFYSVVITTAIIGLLLLFFSYVYFKYVIWTSLLKEKKTGKGLLRFLVVVASYFFIWIVIGVYQLNAMNSPQTHTWSVWLFWLFLFISLYITQFFHFGVVHYNKIRKAYFAFILLGIMHIHRMLPVFIIGVVVFYGVLNVASILGYVHPLVFSATYVVGAMYLNYVIRNYIVLLSQEVVAHR